MPITPNRTRRLRVLRDALRNAQTVGPFSLPVVAGLGAGFLASFGADALLVERLGTPWRQVVDGIVFAVVAAPAWLVIQRRDVRDAIDVLTWLNGWETERWQKEIGQRMPMLPRSTPELLDTLPDTMGLRPLRVELLAEFGELDEARERLSQLPTDTPWQRFERAALEEWVAWCGNRPARLSEMAAAAPHVEDADRRLVARTMLAAAMARRATVSGGDVIGPLAGVRPELGARPHRYAFPYAVGVILSVTFISLVAVAAVMITAALIR